MTNLVCNPLGMMTLTIGCFLLGCWMQRKSKMSMLNPCLTAMMMIIFLLKQTGISYTTYFENNQIIHFMLGPSVVALGVSLYDQLGRIKGNVATILASVIAGSVVGIVSVVLIGRLFGLSDVLVRSFEPKSVTTPIAMSVSQNLGGNVSLTIVAVVMCGIIGAVMGPKVLEIVRVKNPIAKGLALGCASHGVGTARALQMGALEGAISGLAIALMGVATSLLLPLYHLIF